MTIVEAPRTLAPRPPAIPGAAPEAANRSPRSDRDKAEARITARPPIIAEAPATARWRPAWAEPLTWWKPSGREKLKGAAWEPALKQPETREAIRMTGETAAAVEDVVVAEAATEAEMALATMCPGSYRSEMRRSGTDRRWSGPLAFVFNHVPLRLSRLRMRCPLSGWTARNLTARLNRDRKTRDAPKPDPQGGMSRRTTMLVPLPEVAPRPTLATRNNFGGAAAARAADFPKPLVLSMIGPSIGPASLWTMPTDGKTPTQPSMPNAAEPDQENTSPYLRNAVLSLRILPPQGGKGSLLEAIFFICDCPAQHEGGG